MDDIGWVLPKMVEADAIVLGTPVYHYNIIHYLQRLRERTLPLTLPYMVVRKGGPITLLDIAVIVPRVQ